MFRWLLILVCLCLVCLRNRTTLRFDFLHSFMVCAQTSVFDTQNSEIQDSQLRMRINTKPNTQNAKYTTYYITNTTNEATYIRCLRNRTTLRFDFLHSQTYAFLVTNQPKCHCAVSLHFCLPFVC